MQDPLCASILLTYSLGRRYLGTGYSAPQLCLLLLHSCSWCVISYGKVNQGEIRRIAPAEWLHFIFSFFFFYPSPKTRDSKAQTLAVRLTGMLQVGRGGGLSYPTGPLDEQSVTKFGNFYQISNVEIFTPS